MPPRSRTTTTILWGIVVYDDGFRKVRRTRFCHRYNCVNLDYVYDEESTASFSKIFLGEKSKAISPVTIVMAMMQIEAAQAARALT
ncbi:MAG TPA: hypothetical protein VF866_00265 [Xanthobacteraceae bacterium]